MGKMKILDIDLDFFLNDIANSRSDYGERLSSDEYFPWEAEDVKAFLECQCGLTKENKIKGRMQGYF